jgi:cell division septation protein DedD
LRNRIDYTAQRCAALAQGLGPSTDTVHSGGVPNTPPAAGGRSHADSIARRPTPATSSSGTRRTPAAAAPPAGASPPTPAGAAATTSRLRKSGYTVQVAAYETRAAATALVDKLGRDGYVARIYGSAAPFRVRIGQFATEAQADSAIQSLKHKGIAGFATSSESPKI